MKMKIFIFILAFGSFVKAQNSGLTPAEMSNFKDQLYDQKARENAEKAAAEMKKPKYAPDAAAPQVVVSPEANAAPAVSGTSTTAPQPGVSNTPAGPTPPVSGTTESNPVGALMQSSQDQAAKIEKEIKSLLNQNPPAAPKKIGGKDEVVLEKRVKSPFMIPDELYFKIKRKMGEKSQFVAIDETVEVRLRWPLAEYTLVGVIWDTRRPKAMIKDKQGKVHVFREKELIANGGGYVAEISNGEVIVVERGAEIKMQLKPK